MTNGLNEPSDHHVHNLVFARRDGLDFFLRALKFYQTIIDGEIEQVRSDPDLVQLLPKDEEQSAIQAESSLIRWTVEMLEQQLGGRDSSRPWLPNLRISHGTVRLMKSVAALYLGHLRLRRNHFAARRNVSMHVLGDIDRGLSKHEELLEAGVFGLASARPLLVEQALPTYEPADVLPESLAMARRPAPVILDSVAIRDDELRRRCLDLIEKFTEEGQEDRLDSVVTEATRILEDRLRRVSGVHAESSGMELVGQALGGARPRLVVSVVTAEQAAVHQLFRGVFGFIRNPVHHRLAAPMAVERVLQIVSLVDYLIWVIESASPQEVEPSESENVPPAQPA